MGDVCVSYSSITLLTIFHQHNCTGWALLCHCSLCAFSQDSVRSDAFETVQDLHRQGIRTIMLSGDHQGAALEVAEAVGIAKEDVFAGVKPAGVMD